jgi:aryl-alcohol dehydrogenase-like predicted oxidoreductase
MTIAGSATAEGTARFHQRHASAVAADHARDLGGLVLSSVGLGTYLGPVDDAADKRYRAAIARCLEVGINTFDAAINYRHQRSERALGRAILEATAAGIGRDEIVVATKAGFLPLDADEPGPSRAYFERTYVAPGLVHPDEIVAGCHCIAPRYLEDQLARSRRNLGLATIDVYYLHNPETQLDEVSPAELGRRLRAAFEVLERARADGAIGCYGTATWAGYRDRPGSHGHLELDAVVAAARDVGGDGHGLRVVQLPLNRRMNEAATAATQVHAGRARTALAAAAELGLYAFTSATIDQGKLAPDPAAGAEAIRWARTQPGVGTALVGMGRPEHVTANAAAFTR